jgi:hypothetical protein
LDEYLHTRLPNLSVSFHTSFPLAPGHLLGVRR